MTWTDNRIDTITYKKHDIATYQDEDPQDPRDWDNISKICIRKHRNYTFPNELGYNFSDEYDEEDLHNIEIAEKYYIFELDSYEHWGITFPWLEMVCNADLIQVKIVDL